jgi:hypothetical protein
MLRSTRVPPHKRNLFADPTAITLRAAHIRRFVGSPPFPSETPFHDGCQSAAKPDLYRLR